jgi:hypothetical protein
MTSDWQRVVAFLREHPGSSRGEMQEALGWAVNVTGRISDARAHGFAFVKVRVDGVWRYSVKEARFAPVQGEQVGAW